jgi:hypothetical protein
MTTGTAAFFPTLLRMLWTDAEWLAGVHAWIGAHVDPIGPIEQPHVRPWSTVLRVPTTFGDAWFKANAPQLAHEARVVQLLSARRPDLVPPPLAVDAERGWLLLPDAGARLREVVAAERDLSRWLDILTLYAQLQLDATPDTEQLLAAGTPDLRLATLPERYEEAVADVEELPEAREAVGRVRDLCARLAAHGIPETIQHDDLHDGQVFVQDGAYRLLDWGDACVSHPFLSLSVTLEGFLAWGLDDVEGSVDLGPFRDAYLGPFAAYGAPSELADAVEIALRLGWACRAVNGDLDSSIPQPDRRRDLLTRLRMFLFGRAD